MPRSKYTPAPGPFLLPHNIAKFRYPENQRRKLMKLLPKELHEPGIEASFLQLIDEFHAKDSRPQIAPQLMSKADIIMMATEEQVGLHLSWRDTTKKRPPTPAKERAAIRRVLQALEPLRKGYATEETANLIAPDTFEALEKRGEDLKTVRISSAQHGPRMMLIWTLGFILRLFPELDRPHIFRFIFEALNFAGVKCPDPGKHPEQLAKHVFPLED
jgi:hypothetical protein